MKQVLFPLLLLALSLTAGCATSFTPRQNGQVILGAGGAVKESNGIDIWETGEPAQPYVIIGVVHNASESNMAGVAKKNGGDAIILVTEPTASDGYSDDVIRPERVGKTNEVVVVKYVGPQSIEGFRKAAEQGNATAQCNLGFCCAKGAGTSRDYQEAVKWYRKAAEQGNATAQCNLGNCYYQGQGVPQDYVEALKWYNLADAQGDKNAGKWRADLWKEMTPEQIAEAQRRAAQFVVSPARKKR